MNRCDKTGLTDKDFKTILDVLNVFDPGDIAHIYPKMGCNSRAIDPSHTTAGRTATFRGLVPLPAL